jgi:hypothetical protein
MENEGLGESQFAQLPSGDRGAFLPIGDATSDVRDRYGAIGLCDDAADATTRRVVRVVTLRAGMPIFRLSQFEEKWERDTLSSWWSAAEPFEENDLGASDVFQTAMINGVTMRDLVRFISAVKLDWNLLDYYIEARLAVDIQAFWGQFDPKTSTDGEVKGATVTSAPSPGGDETLVHYVGTPPGDEVYLPNVLGGFGAWQLYVPNFSKLVIDPASIVNVSSTDREALADHFGIDAPTLAGLVARGARMQR